MSQEILAIRIDHKRARTYTHSYHIGCYPWPISQEEIAAAAVIVTATQVTHLTKTSGYEDATSYGGMARFLWQRCSECGKTILPYRHIVTYKLAGNTHQVGIDDVVKHYHYYWNMHGVATLELLTINYPEDSVEVRFWTYESCAGILVHRTAINGVLPTIEAEKGNEDATENKSG